MSPSLTEFVLDRMREEEATTVHSVLGIEHPHPDGYWLGPFTDWHQATSAAYLHERMAYIRALCNGRHTWHGLRLRRPLRVAVLRQVAALYATHPDYDRHWTQATTKEQTA